MCFLPSVTQIQQNTSSTVGHGCTHTYSRRAIGSVFLSLFPMIRFSSIHLLFCFHNKCDKYWSGWAMMMMMMTSLNWITVIKILPNKWPSGKNGRATFNVHTHAENDFWMCVKMMPDSMIWILHLCAQIKYCWMFADDIYQSATRYNTIYRGIPQLLTTQTNEGMCEWMKCNWLT